jgi:transglutaminase superfamily protein
MRRYLGWCLAYSLLVVTFGSAADIKKADPAPKAKPALETWEAAFLGDARAGYVHTLVKTIERDGATIYHATTDLNLTVKRFDNVIQLQMTTGSEEDSDGKVLAVWMRQMLGKGQFLILKGTVDGKVLNVTVDEERNGEINRRMEKKVAWNDQVLGLYRQKLLFQDKKVKPEETFDYLSYEPSINSVIKTNVTVKDYEEVEVRGTKKKLLRVEVAMDKIKVGEATINLPGMTAWLDKDYSAERSVMEVPGLGKLTLYRGTREQATGGASTVARVQDIGLSQLVRLNKKILRPYDLENAVYKITIKGDDDPSTAFTTDDRQTIKNVKGNTFELHVRARRKPKAVEEPEKVKDEYLQACYFLNSDDKLVKQHAAQAVGTEKDPWRKALKIERWVHDHMTNKNFTEAFATASQVARTKEGDCTEHAVLAAAMCRAAGVPSRTAFGLVYVDSERGPTMGFHMWAEVYVNGQWIPIDATLGRGFVGATHLKISDHSWAKTESLTPLLPVVRVVGKVSIEVLKVGNGE